MDNQRIIIPKHGSAEVMRLHDEAMPEPKPHEVLIKVQTTGISFCDVLAREGILPNGPTTPFTPGFDVVGVVEKVGDKVKNFKRGQQVVAVTFTGSYTRYKCIPETDLIATNDHLDPIKTEPVVFNYLVAYQLLHRVANVNRGERILVHGAGGGIGSAILQLGKLLNLEMYGTGTGRKLHIIDDLGAHAIDHSKQYFVRSIADMTKTGVDAVFDPMGGRHWLSSYQSLRSCGRLVMYGMSNMTKRGSRSALREYLTRARSPEFSAEQLMYSGRSVCGYNIGAYKSYHQHLYQEDLKTVLALLKTEKIDPIVSEILPLTDAIKGHKILQQSHTGGRIVIVCNTL